MSHTPRDGAENWRPNEPLPLSFTEQDQIAFQKRIDAIVGMRDGRSIIKLVWAPAEKRWYPHAHGTEAPGYTFPIFHAYTNKKGELIAAPRWVLMERLEWEQFGPTWEATRYTIEEKRFSFAQNEFTGEYLLNPFGDRIPINETGDGRLWDWKGPCPEEKYVELFCHCYHDGKCCPCIKYGICECGEQYDHCWGRYLEPDERLLDWIREKAFEARNDPDVQPTRDIRDFEAPEAQRDLRTEMIHRQEQEKEEAARFSAHMLSHWERKPHSTSGLVTLN